MIFVTNGERKRGMLAKIDHHRPEVFRRRWHGSQLGSWLAPNLSQLATR